MHIHQPTTLLFLFNSLTSAACTLPLLHSLTASLQAAQTSGSKANTTFLTPTPLFTQNRRATTLSSSILSTPLHIDHARSQHNLPQCATYSEFIVLNATAPYVIATQMRVDNNTGQVAKLHSIVTTTGDWLFNVTGTYYWASRESWGPVPEAQRSARNVVQAAGDAYCDLFNDKSVVVPWGSPCARLEGGCVYG